MGENQGAWRKPCYKGILSITNSVWTALGLNLGPAMIRCQLTIFAMTQPPSPPPPLLPPYHHIPPDCHLSPRGTSHTWPNALHSSKVFH